MMWFLLLQEQQVRAVVPANDRLLRCHGDSLTDVDPTADYADAKGPIPARSSRTASEGMADRWNYSHKDEPLWTGEIAAAQLYCQSNPFACDPCRS
ncbi:hypothetical protein CPY51_09070 [Rhizobium tubonense]|uniref:Uncharacterized protein n=1 Tax=Rhizobium tubonense TaxID=484088 RepID=A0A2W4EW37_9HYPH|nr:hypothetical protein CPY51_09070 [Rhizobium tubonense]